MSNIHAARKVERNDIIAVGEHMGADPCKKQPMCDIRQDIRRRSRVTDEQWRNYVRYKFKKRKQI